MSGFIFEKPKENGKTTSVFIPEDVRVAKTKLGMSYLGLIIKGIESFNPDKIQVELSQLKEDNENLRRKLVRYALNVGAIQEKLKQNKKVL